jgi:hypothetical protein
MRCNRCSETIEPRRVELGYRTCFECSSPRKRYTIAHFHKQGYQLISASDVKYLSSKQGGMNR